MMYKDIIGGIGGTTKIGFVRSDLEDPMYLRIEDMNPSKSYRIYCADNCAGFFSFRTAEIRNSREKVQTYKYRFINDCSIGKPSFGTEEELVATPNSSILKFDGTIVCLGDLKDGDKVISIKRLTYSSDVSTCTSEFILSYKYYKEYVYNIVFTHRGVNFCADGFFVGSIK